MSMLYPDGLPYEVTVNGVEHEIRPQYYIALEIIKILGDIEAKQIDAQTGLALIFDLFYIGTIPEDINDGFTAINNFIDAGSWSNGYKGKSKSRRQAEDALDWEIDAPFIWASLKQAYPFWDWSNAHWWEFKAAFDSLPASSKVKEVMGIRMREIKKDMSKDEKESIKELKRFYKLPRGEGEPQGSLDIEAELKRKASEG